jgi:hypothetical protein
MSDQQQGGDPIRVQASPFRDGGRDRVDDGSPAPEKGGEPGRYFWYRPGEILVLEPTLSSGTDRLVGRLEDTRGVTARGVQRGLKRAEAPSAFDVALYELAEPDRIDEVLSELRGEGVTCDYNYVTGPRPIRIHAVADAEPAAVEDVAPRPDGPERKTVAVGVLDTGRPYYDAGFRTYYDDRYRSEATPADQRSVMTSALDVLDGWFEKPAPRPADILVGPEEALATIKPDQDTMVAPFGRLLHPHAGHGLFVASIIARNAPSARLRMETTMSADGIGDVHDMLLDLDHALANGCEVINMSMGFYSADNRCPTVLEHALTILARGHGCQVIASAGNDGSNRKLWPAAHPTVGSVGSVGPDEQPSEWSNFGPWVQAWAQGEGVLSDYVFADYDYPDGTAKRFRGAARWSGTSFAAPLVTARLVVALTETRAGRPATTARAAWRTLISSAPDGHIR